MDFTLEDSKYLTTTIQDSTKILKSFNNVSTHLNNRNCSNVATRAPFNDLDESSQIKCSIYTEFKLSTNKNIDEDFNLTDLLRSYSSICSENSFFLKDKLNYLSTNRQKDLFNLALNEQDELDKEKNLWNLIFILYSDDLNMNKIGNEDNLTLSNEGINEQLIAKNLEQKNPFLRRIKLVINWLEKIAAESSYHKHVKEKISAYSEKCFSWEHTLHHLKNTNNFNKEKINFSGRDYVNELDPDAPVRLGKPLHDLDQEDEYKMMEYVFAFIRAGELSKAKDFCLKVGQSWRAASFEGFKLFNDENYASNVWNPKMANLQKQEVFKNDGNLNRDIWKMIVKKLIKSDHFNQHEKAVYASLAGFIGPVIPVCKNYMDFIWIFLKSLYEHIIEKEIRQKVITREFINISLDNDEENLFKNIDSQSSYAILNQVFDRIKIIIDNNTTTNISDPGCNNYSMNISSQISKNIKLDSQKHLSIILKHVILSGINGFKTGTNELMEYLKTVIINERQNGVLLRFFAHLSLFYRASSFQLNNDTFIKINESYVHYLIENNYKEIIAYYLSHLPSDLQIKHYSKYLQTINDNKERIMMLKLAKERNMNVQAITINIVDNLSKTASEYVESTTTKELNNQNNQSSLSATAIITKSTNLLTSKIRQCLNDQDIKKINALDWIVYDQTQRLKLLEYANSIMRYFLLEKQNLEATKTVFTKIPQDTIAIILNQFNFSNLNQTSDNIEKNLQQMIDGLPIDVVNSLKEYICFKEYIEAIDLYNSWFEFFNKEKPHKPHLQENDSFSQEQSFAERMTYEYHLKQYDDSRSRWYSKALIYSEKVKAKFFSVLVFPFGGWMNDIKIDKEFIIDEVDDNQNFFESDEDNSIYNENDTQMSDDNDYALSSIKECKKTIKKKPDQRKKSLKDLRKFYLPNFCFILIDMLCKMNLNKDLIRIADLVAADNFKLYTLFENNQLKCFLNKISDASVSLLDSNMDYLG